MLPEGKGDGKAGKQSSFLHIISKVAQGGSSAFLANKKGLSAKPFFYGIEVF
jgi:hypothetical protein